MKCKKNVTMVYSRVHRDRRTITCCGTTTTSDRTNCSAWRTSCATRTCAAPGPSRYRRPRTTRTWSRSALATTSSRRSTTRARAATSPPAARTARRAPWPGPSRCTLSPRKSCTSHRPPRIHIRSESLPGSIEGERVRMRAHVQHVHVYVRELSWIFYTK